MNTTMPPYILHSLERRAIEVGDLVTDEDPTDVGYGKIGRVLHVLPPGEAFSADPLMLVVSYPIKLNGQQVHRTRSTVRSVHDKPMSAQIGMGAVWEVSDAETA